MHLCKDNTSKKLFLQNIKVAWFLTFHEISNAIKAYFMLIFILYFIVHNISHRYTFYILESTFKSVKVNNCHNLSKLILSL